MLRYNRNNQTLTINYNYNFGHNGNWLSNTLLSRYASITNRITFRMNCPQPEKRYSYGPLSQDGRLNRISEIVRIINDTFESLMAVNVVFTLAAYNSDQLYCAAPFLDLHQQWTFKYKLNGRWNVVDTNDRDNGLMRQLVLVNSPRSDSRPIPTTINCISGPKALSFKDKKRILTTISWHNNNDQNHRHNNDYKSDIDSDSSCSELKFETNDRALTIEFDYQNSDSESHLSNYASSARKIYFNITFPAPGNDSDSTARITREIEDIVNIFNEFTNLSHVEVTSRLKEKHLGQLACALPFHEIRNRGGTFTYYVDGQYQGRVPMNSQWYEQLQDEDSLENHSHHYGSDHKCESGEDIRDNDSD
ncbi:hypothetical protein OCU04_007095 [Sclerotinia nivalis]|uniref:Uncharacterized protein n=1 Tax=Sclerotinia nivalis TaxID=352851 RepID=A0A9X0DJL0_9HELO|nr:hypothetical protein OCU04_007095 [Sclerotinia nivalis]